MLLHSFAKEEICSTFVTPLADRAKEQRIQFFGGEIFRQQRRNTRVENGLKICVVCA
jgi:hypothetical protein